jgi:hypothetical protein
LRNPTRNAAIGHDFDAPLDATERGAVFRLANMGSSG